MRNPLIQPGELLLPAPGTDLTAWACVACDQYTSQPEYWREAEALVGTRASALRLVLPEVYLDQAEARIPAIHQAMRQALADGTLTPAVDNGWILTVRSIGSGERVGLVAMLDLEGYDYQPGSKTPVRATEGTIVERIPPRLQVRRNAALELSHVLLLIDDPLRSVLEPLYARRDTLPQLYDFPLMLGGGHLRGYAVADPAELEGVQSALEALAIRREGRMLFAVGDGNHSLATAKAYWEELKRALPPEELAGHPARFAMVEIENIHDNALVFEPIHRVLYGAQGDVLLEDLKTYARRNGLTLADGPAAQRIGMAYGDRRVSLSLCGSQSPLAVGTLQAFLDAWLTGHPDVRLDYVHGEETAYALAGRADTVAFLLPAFPKNELFPAVEKMGALPRKTFSMGEAQEKRYYLEARKLER